MAEENVRHVSPERKLLTVERLRQLLSYDPETGIFTWRANGNHKNSHEGRRAGAVSASGGVVIRVDYVIYHAHRLAWFYVHGVWPANFVDHVNRNRADNRLANLREADRPENCWNSKRPRSNTSGHKGVNYVKPTGKWRAVIKCRGVTHFLGGFATKEEAVAAYADAAARLHGEFASLS